MEKKIVLALTDKEVDKLVRISGTQHDRRRKLNDKQLESVKKMFYKGKSLYYIADKFNVHPNTIRYHVDENYRRYRIDHANYENTVKPACCSQKNYKESLSERATYKRELVARGRVKI